MMLRASIRGVARSAVLRTLSSTPGRFAVSGAPKDVLSGVANPISSNPTVPASMTTPSPMTPPSPPSPTVAPQDTPTAAASFSERIAESAVVQAETSNSSDVEAGAAAASQVLESGDSGVDIVEAISSVPAVLTDITPPALVAQLVHMVECAAPFGFAGATIAVTMALRTAMLPLTVAQQQTTVKMTNLAPKSQAIQAKIQTAKENQDQAGMAKATSELMSLWSKNGVKPFLPFAAILVQAPVFISMFMGLRRAAEEMPSLATESFLWVDNLTIPDPTYVLPTMSALSFLASTELSMRLQPEGRAMQQSPIMKWVMRSLSVISFPIGVNMPAAVLVYWNATNLYTMVQTVLINNSKVRAMVNIPKFEAPPKTALPKTKSTEAPVATGPAPVTFSSNPMLGKKKQKKARKTM